MPQPLPLSFRFNSSLVRLEAEAQAYLTKQLMGFQFQLGSIRRSVFNGKVTARFLSFNSSLVRLEGARCRAKRWAKESFNSSLVRLEGCLIRRGNAVGDEFQFQLGSIRRRTVCLLGQRATTGFNSSLVRLEEEVKQNALVAPFPFQFQLGSIRRAICSLSHSTTSGFNSSLVRLEVWVSYSGWSDLELVSIPAWFD